MKLLHTADLHTGRHFHNVSLLEDQKHVLAQIIEHAREQEVDALVIAGDIYDRSQPPGEAVQVFDDFLNTFVSDLKIPVLMIPGNHDSAERVRFGSRQLCEAGVYIFGKLEVVDKPVTLNLGGETVSFYGIPYNDPESVRNTFKVEVRDYDKAHAYLVDRIREVMDSDQVNVLISHCFIAGSMESDSERPLSIGGADQVSPGHFTDFDYVALGHLHQQQQRGEEYIRYSGSILKYSFSEQHHKKAVTLVEIDEHGFKGQQQLPLVPLKNMRVIEGMMDDILEQGATDPENEDYLLVRLQDKEAILDPMARLREVYPNVLHLERPGLRPATSHQASRETLEKSALDLFKEFYEKSIGENLSEEQEAIVVDAIDSATKRLGDRT